MTRCPLGPIPCGSLLEDLEGNSCCPPWNSGAQQAYPLALLEKRYGWHPLTSLSALDLGSCHLVSLGPPRSKESSTPVQSNSRALWEFTPLSTSLRLSLSQCLFCGGFFSPASLVPFWTFSLFTLLNKPVTFYLLASAHRWVLPVKTNTNHNSYDERRPG